MSWIAIKFHFQLFDESYFLYKIKEFLNSEEINIYPFYFERGYQDAFYIKLYIKADVSDHAEVLKKFENFRKRTTDFKRYKFYQAAYIPEIIKFGGQHALPEVQRLLVSGSRVAMDLIFSSEEFKLFNYFNLLIRALILNYLTVKHFLPNDIQSDFFKKYSDFLCSYNDDTVHDPRFDVDEIKQAMSDIDISNILNLVDDDGLDLDTDLDGFAKACIDTNKTLRLLLSENKLEVESKLYPQIIFKDQLYGVLIEICESNFNRMAILYPERAYLGNCLEMALS